MSITCLKAIQSCFMETDSKEEIEMKEHSFFVEEENDYVDSTNAAPFAATIDSNSSASASVSYAAAAAMSPISDANANADLASITSADTITQQITQQQQQEEQTGEAAAEQQPQKQRARSAFTTPSKFFLLRWFYLPNMAQFFAAFKYEFMRLFHLIWLFVVSNICFAILLIENTSLIVCNYLVALIFTNNSMYDIDIVCIIY